MRKVGQAYKDINGQQGSFGLVLNDATYTLEKNNIVKIGIQAPPGSQFTLDQNIVIEIGISGLFELEDPEISIDEVSFSSQLRNIIIDYVYEE